MNMELTRNALVCRKMTQRSIIRAYGTRDMYEKMNGRSMTGGGRVRTVSERERKRLSQDDEMRAILNGMGGKLNFLQSLDRGSLHLLMALKETGQDALVRQVLTTGVERMEWKVSLRQLGVEETG